MELLINPIMAVTRFAHTMGGDAGKSSDMLILQLLAALKFFPLKEPVTFIVPKRNYSFEFIAVMNELVLYICIPIACLLCLCCACYITLMRYITNHCDTAESLLSDDTIKSDLSGKIVVITGANAGIGAETLRVMANTKATIIMACRNLKKSSPIQESVINESGNKSIDLMKLDLGDLNQINEFVDAFKAKYNRLDLLFCNAAISPYSSDLKTGDGLELAFGVNHIGNMHLILLLKDLLTNTSNIDDTTDRNKYSRVIITNAMLHREKPMLECMPKNFEYDIEKLNDHQKTEAYCHSKLCSMMFVKEFVDKYPLENCKIYCIALHPGVGMTELIANKNNKGDIKSHPGEGCCGEIMKNLFCLPCLMDSVGQLAFTQTWCGLVDVDKLCNGGYYAGTNQQRVDPLTLDKEKRNELWNASMKCIKDIVGTQEYMNDNDIV